MADSKEMRAGSVWTTCPECDASIEIEVNCTVVDPDETDDGKGYLDCQPDMADVWAHMWTHNA